MPTPRPSFMANLGGIALNLAGLAVVFDKWLAALCLLAIPAAILAYSAWRHRAFFVAPPPPA